MRTARVLVEGIGHYHIILKTTGPLFLFQRAADKEAFLGLLERVSRFSAVDVLVYALLDNHIHLLVRVPLRESVPPTELAVRLEALYGADRAKKLLERWKRMDETSRGNVAAAERDRLYRRMYDLGQFVKTLKEWYARYYSEANGWEGTLWRGRYKSVWVGGSYQALKDTALYIAMNPVKAGIVAKGTDSPWTSYGGYRRKGSFGWKCHQALLQELVRLGSWCGLSEEGTDSMGGSGQFEGTDSMARRFDEEVARAEAVKKEEVRRKLDKGESLSLYEMMLCEVHAFSNGKAIGTLRDIESVPIRRKRVTGVARSTCGLFNATGLRGILYRVA